MGTTWNEARAYSQDPQVASRLAACMPPIDAIRRAGVFRRAAHAFRERGRPLTREELLANRSAAYRATHPFRRGSRHCQEKTS